MDLALDSEQQMIASSAIDWLRHNYDFRQRESGVHRDGGSPAVWQAFAELGWLGLPLAEADGGLGMGPLECGLLAQALGRFLVVEPVIDSTMQAARLLSLAGNSAQRQTWLPGVAAGSHRLAFAHAEASTGPWDPPALCASRTGDGWNLRGEKGGVMSALGASHWIVSATTIQDGERAQSLFLVDSASAGVSLDVFDTLDGARAADVRLDGVIVPDINRLGGDSIALDAASATRRVLAEGIVLRCWEATGVMQASFEQTTAYVQQRRQFGQALASFQVVQHRLAEMAAACAEAQAACELASMSLPLTPDAQLRDVAASARSKVARAARDVSQDCVQLHGAMGVCEELPIASAFRSLLAFSQRQGNAAEHATALGRSLLATGAHSQSRTVLDAETPTSGASRRAIA